jgi:hypothetical protein
MRESCPASTVSSHFNPTKGVHMKSKRKTAGFFKRLVRYAKELLRKLIRASGLVEFAAERKPPTRRRRVAPAQ